MKLDTVMLSSALGEQLQEFLNELWGSPEAAAEELLDAPSPPPRSRPEGTTTHTADVLRAFIEKYDAIAHRAGWRGRSLLAYAIAVESCIQDFCAEDDERIALLSLRRLLDATGSSTRPDNLSVLSLQIEIDSRIDELSLLQEKLVRGRS